jgi:hypothetical protein
LTSDADQAMEDTPIEAEAAPEMAEPTEQQPEPTEEIAATEPVNWLVNEGKTADGLTFLGNPDAPVTMIDYSDFM